MVVGSGPTVGVMSCDVTVGILDSESSDCDTNPSRC